ncbi:rRNA adenine N-6-methyltransferase family protein, partial [Actinomadura adrarensis]
MTGGVQASMPESGEPGSDQADLSPEPKKALGRRLERVLPLWLIGRLVRSVYPRLEPELSRLSEYVPAGGTAVDIGGWFGPWTRRLAKRADRVVTIEADPRLAALLRRTFSRVDVVH